MTVIKRRRRRDDPVPDLCERIQRRLFRSHRRLSHYELLPMLHAARVEHCKRIRQAVADNHLFGSI